MKEQPIVMEGAYAKQYTDWMVTTGGYAWADAMLKERIK